MRFAEPIWLFGTGVGLLVALFLILGGVLGVRAARRFGFEEQVKKLFTANAGSRRAVKGVLLVLAVAAGLVALAQPQYGRGTRTIPATNLDVVITLDYSKSMYAQDIPPFRIERAKAEVADLVAALPGARFGAVAFAGEPMSFPLTSDSGAIKQFLNQLSPNDMPVGGTAIARALESARDLLARDPISRRHKRVIILITDGEDLEGDPVQVAQSCAQEDITLHVVQIGSRTAEPLPEIDSAGRVTGLRKDESGAAVTTALSAEGEAALAKIAETAGGTIVRSQRGKMGIDAITSRLRKLMTEELSEKVETVYADVYMYPLSVAALLLLIEVLIGEAKRRGKRQKAAGPEGDVHSTKRRESLMKKTRGRAPLASLLLMGLALSSCDPNPSKWFERYSPAVDDAVEKLDAGDSAGAQQSLIEYLKTGKCEGGKIGTPESVKERPFAAFDLGLALFRLAEKFGKKFGEEGLAHGAPDAPPDPAAQKAEENRRDQVDCALRIAQAIALDPATPAELRARAHYLSGNLEFLRGNYRGAVSHYDKALRLVPGVTGDAGDLLGQDAAFNRSIALRRIDEEKPDASPDAGSDGGQDGGDDGGSDAGSDAGNDAGDSPPDAGQDSGSPQDQDSGPPDAGDAGQEQPKDASADDASAQEQEKSAQKPNGAENQRVMDMLERAPTLQQELAKKARVRRALSAAEDR
ncbi:MAG: VWA domain-containing protein [Polyangiaceae bacterium]|nr:VWA domain-containing protein [Polyangiaceae bacterium]